MFFLLFFDTVKNICNKTLTFKFKRKRFLLSEKNKHSKALGYARATHNEHEYLEEQIKILKKEGCSLVFSEFITLDEEIKPQLNKAIIVDFLAILLKLLRSDICIKNNVMKSDSILVNETKTL